MKKLCITGVLVFAILMHGCGFSIPQQMTAASGVTKPTWESIQPTVSIPQETTAATTQPATENTTEMTQPATTETAPEHAALYIPWLSVEDVICYFNEVCLDAEMVHSGDPSLLQKWTVPILYTLEGPYTDEDHRVLTDFAQWLNTVEGFPGFSEASEAGQANLRIHFCGQEEMLQLMGDGFSGLDGAVTFWYNGYNEIYDATVCYRTDIDQHLRNSVILEEIYNGLGPIQDTQLRQESIIYSGFSMPQSLTGIDMLILKLLYHPQMVCGMNAAECEAVIRELYY